MSKVRTISRTFLKGHPKSGQPTYFVEQFINSVSDSDKWCQFWHVAYLEKLYRLNSKNIELGKITREQIKEFWESLNPEINTKKHHTIRSGTHFKGGDSISVRCWSKSPYNSPQIILWEDVEVRTWNIKRKDGWFHTDFLKSENDIIEDLATNDGLSINDFLNWFPAEFSGQIICWSDKIEY